MMKNDFKIQKNVPLAPLSTFGIGGKARMYICVHTPDELKAAVIYAKAKMLPYKIFAGGSNVVFPDEKVDSLLIHINGGNLKRVQNSFTVDCGVELSTIVDESIKKGLTGLEYLSGIPGTVGGAVVGNAGAYGHSISEHIEYVDVFDDLTEKRLKRKYCEFGYRESIFKKKFLIVLRICFSFPDRERKELEKLSRDIIRQREVKYHPGIRCPGSFFKNVLEIDVSKKSLSLLDQDVIISGKIPAGYLLGEAGAKGLRVGGIEVATYHGNLFINRGGGSAKDVKELAMILKKRVYGKFHIQLEEEIRYI